MSNEFSRDYDVGQINKEEMDPRFHAAAREGIMTEVVYFLTVIVGMVVAYVMAPDDPTEVSYVLGFPTWLAAGVLIYAAGTIGLLVYFLKAKNFSFEPKA